MLFDSKLRKKEVADCQKKKINRVKKRKRKLKRNRENIMGKRKPCK